MVELKKLKWFLDRSNEGDGLQEKDSEFIEFPWRRKQDVTVGWQLLSRPLGWLMYVIHQRQKGLPSFLKHTTVS